MSLRTLKIKIKVLAEEARIIRHEERRIMRGARWCKCREIDTQANTISDSRREFLVEHCDIHQHRVVDVRQEARAALLAYAFLRGRTLTSTERPIHCRPSWQRVVTNINIFTHESWNDLKPRFEEWVRASNLPEEMLPNLT